MANTDTNDEPFTATLNETELKLDERYRNGAYWSAELAGRDARFEFKFVNGGVRASLEFQDYLETRIPELDKQASNPDDNVYVFKPRDGPYEYTFTVEFDDDKTSEFEQPYFSAIDHPVFELTVGDRIRVKTVPGSGGNRESQMVKSGVISQYEDKRSEGIDPRESWGGETVCSLVFDDGDGGSHTVEYWVSEDDDSLKLRGAGRAVYSAHIESIEVTGRKFANQTPAGFPVYGPQAGMNASATEGKDVPDDPIAAAVEAEVESGWLDATPEQLHDLDTASPEVEIRYDAKYGDGEKTVEGTIDEIRREEYRTDGSDAAVWPSYMVFVTSSDDETYLFTLDARRGDEEKPDGVRLAKQSTQRTPDLGPITQATVSEPDD